MKTLPSRLKQLSQETHSFASPLSTEQSTALVSGAQALVLSLLAEGVDTLFGYPGGAIMPVYDSFFDYRDRLRHVLVRHEQGAIHAAQGYARASGKTGVCIATSGPGATNLVTGIADAQIDSTPLVCLTGQVPSALLGTDAFQETDIINVTAPITKWNVQVRRAEDIPAALARAFYLAKTGRPGPVLVDITKDAQLGQTCFQYEPCRHVRGYTPTVRASLDSIEKAAELINHAKRPLILVGQGVLLSGAEQELRDFAEKLGAPVASTLLGLSGFPSSHEQFVGMVGMHGRYGANTKTNECDVLIAIGMRFDDRVTGDLRTYAKQAKVIHLEIDAAEINKNVQATVALHGDAKHSLAALLPRIRLNSFPAWLREFRDCDAIEHEKVCKHDLEPQGASLHMGEVVKMLTDKTQGQAIVVSDVGQHQMAAARYSMFEKPRTSVTSGGLGTMGFALPAAVGAKLACPEKTVVAIIGDGGFQMTMQELGTAVQSGADVKIVILNNSFLGMVRQWQELFFDRRYSETHMQNPNFVQIAKAYGIEAKKVTQRSELNQAVDEMLAHRGVFLLEVAVEQEANVFPMVPASSCVSKVRLGS